ncbi:hypothetical protein ACFLU5_09515 [Bacteroidota bacterium]
MKKIYIILALLIMVSISCRDDDLVPYPAIEDHIGAITLVTPNPDKLLFNPLNNLATEEIEFVLDVDGFGVTTVSSVDVILIFTENDALVDVEGNPIDSVYAPIVVINITQFPSTVTLTGQEAADLIGMDVSDFEVGDSFQLTFPMNTNDGRTLTVALASDLCNEPAQPSFGGCHFSWGVFCPIADGMFVGQYDISDDQGIYTGPVNIANLGGTRFRLTGGDWLGLGGDGPFNFDLICDQPSVAEQSNGWTCGPPNDVLIASAADPGWFDIDDDSQFVIRITYTNSGCFGGFDSELTLTKL